jgi:flagellar hook-basal body complex protein FliE
VPTLPTSPVAGVSLGPEFAVPGVETPPELAPAVEKPESFGSMLGVSLERLEGMLTDASQQSAALASGQAEDLTSVVVAVERATLGLQLATQVRNKAVEAYQDLFRMQI